MTDEHRLVLDIGIGDDATLTVVQLEADQFVVGIVPTDPHIPDMILWQCDAAGMQLIGTALATCVNTDTDGPA